MAIDRRTFLVGALAGPLALLPGLARARGGPRFINCRQGEDGHAASALDGRGALLWSTPLPGRGHGMATHPGGRHCAVVARRPGRFLLVLDIADGRVRHRLSSVPGRHYCGHAVYGRDGAALFATENDYEAGRGVIGIYDVAAGYRRRGEIPSHGVGPHELRLLGDGHTLVVANGGILTHPDYGRAKLNLDTMASVLSFVDARDGRLEAAHRLPAALHQLSIRHIDVAADGTVALAMQYQGAASAAVPLVGLARAQEGMRLLEAPAELTARMRNYCGSVAFNATGERFAVSAPRGGLVIFWSADGRFLDHRELADGCAVAPDPRGAGFALSSGRGQVVFTDAPGRPGPHRFPDSRWDNHMSLAG